MELKEVDARTYCIQIGNDALKALDKFLSERHASARKFVLLDENTMKHCLPEVSKQVTQLQDAELLEIYSGEKQKNIEVVTGLWEAMIELGADRQSVLINLGGGVIGDIGGFTASTFKRGIDFIHVPTTLLSMADASVGGKTGIDLINLKNQVGTFTDPAAVMIYPPFLKTLDHRNVLSGYAEVIKIALIRDEGFWEELKNTSVADLDRHDIITKAVQLKQNIVSEDPREAGTRKLLNFGHTVGHALETAALKIGVSMLHGEAVALGMLAEAFLSTRYAGLAASQLDEITALIDREFGFTAIAGTDDELLELMQADKKNKGGHKNFTLLNNIGEGRIDVTCEEKDIREAIGFCSEYVH